MSKFLAVTAISIGLTGICGTATAQLPNPSQAANEIGRNNPCADPWVSYAVSVAKSRPGFTGRAAGSGSSHECNPQLYNGGSWNSYDQLVGYARQTLSTLANQNVKYEMINNSPALVLINPGAGLASANIVSGGAGNIVSGGAGNIVSGGAGNIVSGGAGNYQLQNSDGAKAVFTLPNGSRLRVR